MSQLPLAIPCGDPAGVGPDLIASWLGAHPALADSVVPIGPADWIARLGRGLAVGPAGYVSHPGQPDEAGQLIALEAMELAARGTTGGRFAAVVTGPVNKKRLAEVGYPFPGQTEFFAARWGGDPVMAFCGGKLRVALATWHVPLAAVPALLDEPLLRRTIAAARTLALSEGVARPRIGVCGLNPHAGEEGLLGTEERDHLNPILKRLRGRFPGLSSCQPGDTLFARMLRGEFDAVVALYHDQGLAPLKVIDFDDAVNVTLGLTHVRTSPDHGTAFGIAGRGIARGTSFANAVTVARRLIALRG